MSLIKTCPNCGTKNRIGALDEGKVICGKCKQEIPEPGFGTAFELNVESFSYMIQNSKRPTLVDFWAEWCGPCKMMSPLLDQLAAGQTNLRIAKINTEHNPQISVDFGVRSIPTMIIFEKGKEVKRITGAMSPKALEKQLKPWL